MKQYKMFYVCCKVDDSPGSRPFKGSLHMFQVSGREDWLRLVRTEAQNWKRAGYVGEQLLQKTERFLGLVLGGWYPSVTSAYEELTANGHTKEDLDATWRSSDPCSEEYETGACWAGLKNKFGQKNRLLVALRSVFKWF